MPDVVRSGLLFECPLDGARPAFSELLCKVIAAAAPAEQSLYSKSVAVDGGWVSLLQPTRLLNHP